MKKIFTGAILLASLAFTLSSFAQSDTKVSPNFQPICPNPNSAGGMRTNVTCGGGGDPSPGPTGPQIIAPTPGNPTLNWVGQGNQNYSISVGGVVQREKVGAAIDKQHGKLFVAVASNTNDDGNGQHLIRLYSNTDGTSNLNLIGNVTLQYSNGPANGYTAGSPALTYMNNTLYIAFTTATA